MNEGALQSIDLPLCTCKPASCAFYVQRAAKRPVSPHVFEIDGKSMHYKMPVNAISSIINRATGVALSVGEALLSFLSVLGVQKLCLCMH